MAAINFTKKLKMLELGRNGSPHLLISHHPTIRHCERSVYFRKSPPISVQFVPVMFRNYTVVDFLQAAKSLASSEALLAKKYIEI
jgi:hypothetical protein